MRDKVLAFCRREALFAPGAQVVCAVSGGADSVALLHCLLKLRQELGITVTAAHYNHCLRGEASREDEAFVRRLCASWGVTLAVGQGDVAAFAAESGRSVEEAARVLRYEFLLAQKGTVAVAHHADDQVETVLLHLLRGTGLRGLGAMAPKNDRVVRPMLAVTREEILAYLQKEGLCWREDGTNGSDDALRNRLRHHVVPLLKEENPNLSETVGRMTGLLRRDEAYLQAQTEALLQRACRPGGYDARTLRQAPQVLCHRALRQLLAIPKPTMAHVLGAAELLQRDSGSGELPLPGGFVLRNSYGVVSLQCAAAGSFAPLVIGPGQRKWIAEAELEIALSEPELLEKNIKSTSTFAIRCDMMSADFTISVRPRQTGDVLCLSGGTKSVKKLMIDRKIPAYRRGLCPVLTDGERIIAVYGLGADRAWAAAPGDRAVMISITRRENHD